MSKNENGNPTITVTDKEKATDEISSPNQNLGIVGTDPEKPPEQLPKDDEIEDDLEEEDEANPGTESDSSEDPDKEDEIDKGDGESKKRDASKLEIPENVILEPQDPEHMDLSQFKNEQLAKIIRPYLTVSDDKGELLGDLDIVEEVIATCKDLEGKDFKKEEKPQELFNTISDLVSRYMLKINSAENISQGILTKYRIRLGDLLNALKALIKNGLKKKWTDWVKENFGKAFLRSAQDYMRLAEIPNIIKYAVYGTGRLLQIIKRLPETKSDDPIGDFLKVHGIDFDPSEEADSAYEEIRIRTDTAIAKEMVEHAKINDLSDEKLRNFIEAGKKFTPTLIKQLKLVQEVKGDVSDYLDKIIAGDNPKPPAPPATKSDSFKKAFDDFIEITEKAINDADYLSSINFGEFQQLKKVVEDLEGKFPAPSPS